MGTPWGVLDTSYDSTLFILVAGGKSRYTQMRKKIRFLRPGLLVAP